MRSMVAAAGAAPAVTTRTPGRTPRRSSAGALAMAISTVGAAQSMVMRSSLTSAKMRAGSTLRRHTCVAPTAVTVQTNVQPLAWNIGSLHMYLAAGVMVRGVMRAGVVGVVVGGGGSAPVSPAVGARGGWIV